MGTLVRMALPSALSRDIRKGKALKTAKTHDRSGPGGLPAGWQEATAPDGRTYYFNTMTKETSEKRGQANCNFVTL